MLDRVRLRLGATGWDIKLFPWGFFVMRFEPGTFECQGHLAPFSDYPELRDMVSEDGQHIRRDVLLDELSREVHA